jgi:hypothetical protein
MVVFIVEQSSSDSLSLTTVVRDQTPSASNAVCLGVVQIRQIVAAMDASRQLVMVCLQAELPSQSAAWSEPLQLKAGAPPFLPYFQVVTDAAAAAGHTFAPEVRHWASWSSACVGSQCRRGATVRLTAGRPRAQFEHVRVEDFQTPTMEALQGLVAKLAERLEGSQQLVRLSSLFARLKAACID